MGEYKEFTGKTLDSAIKDACTFFNVEREKLEIEIVNDAKSGIFGLVGAKKATVRARKVSLDNIGLNLGVKGKGGKNGADSREAREGREPREGRDGCEGREGRETRAERGNRKNGRGKKENAAEAAPGDAANAENATESSRENSRSAAHSDRPSQQARQQQRPEGKKQPPAGSLASRRAADPAFGQAGAAQAEQAALESHEPADTSEQAEAPASSTSSARPENAERCKNSRGRGRNGNREKGENAEKGRNRQRDGKKAAPKAPRPDFAAETPSGSQAHERGKVEAEAQPVEDDSVFEEQLPVIPLEELDQELLHRTVMETLESLVRPLAGEEAQSEFMLEEGRVRVRLESGEHQGLIIGRDGQTLAALQYLLTCITSRKLGASVRVQIDAGDYREKQDEKLRNLALSLAQKVKNTQRPQSTRPLSAYHRRIIHLTLQDDPDVQTHSKSEGPLKSVVIVPRRKSSK